MVEYSYTPEHLQYISEAAFGLYVLAMCFTTKQRAWIRERDNNVCQACILGLPHSRECNGGPDTPPEERRLEVHHNLPQRYAREHGIDPDFAENGITLSNSFHQEDIHPDMRVALVKYRRGDKKAFKQVSINRDEMLSRRAIYWNDRWDRVLSTRAVQNTQRFEKDNPFPEK